LLQVCRRIATTYFVIFLPGRSFKVGHVVMSRSNVLFLDDQVRLTLNVACLVDQFRFELNVLVNVSVFKDLIQLLI